VDIEAEYPFHHLWEDFQIGAVVMLFGVIGQLSPMLSAVR
jgi:hypothetical protein